MKRGQLFVVPNLLGVVAPEDVLPERTLAVARRLAHYVVENAKPARAFLKSLSPDLPLHAIHITELGADPGPERCAELLVPARSGLDVGLVSDAGCPAIADPGALLVAAAHRADIEVIPLVGPSSLLLALMASGMNGQGFSFHGYLPVQAEPRDAAIRRLEAESAKSGYAQIFIETPYRNPALLAALVTTLRATTRLCVAVDLTLSTQSVFSRPVRAWRGVDVARYAKRPAIFVVQA